MSCGPPFFNRGSTSLLEELAQPLLKVLNDFDILSIGEDIAVLKRVVQEVK
jgi:hypothetical protein